MKRQRRRHEIRLFVRKKTVKRKSARAPRLHYARMRRMGNEKRNLRKRMRAVKRKGSSGGGRSVNFWSHIRPTASFRAPGGVIATPRTRFLSFSCYYEDREGKRVRERERTHRSQGQKGFVGPTETRFNGWLTGSPALTAHSYLLSLPFFPPIPTCELSLYFLPFALHRSTPDAQREEQSFSSVRIRSVTASAWKGRKWSKERTTED